MDSSKMYCPGWCRYRTYHCVAVKYPVSWGVVQGTEWKHAKLRPYQSPWYRVCTKPMVASKGSYGHGEFKIVSHQSVQIPYLPLHGSKVPRFVGGSLGPRMEICETSALPIPMVSRLHQSNGYIERKLRAWRVKKCIALVGADTVLTSSGQETTPFHGRQYRTQNGNMRNFGPPNPHGTAFAPKQWLYQKKATGMESLKIYCQSWWKYRSYHCVAAKYPVSYGVVQGPEWKYAKYRPYQSPWYGVHTKAMLISKGSYGNGESKNVLPKSVQTPYLPLRGSKVPHFMGGSIGRRMEICETSALPIPMVSRLHQSNGYIKRKLRTWRVKKCIVLVGADTVLTSSGPETTPFHGRQYRAQNGNMRNFGPTNPNGTAFAPKKWLYQKEATGMESSKMYSHSLCRYRTYLCVEAKYPVSYGVVQGPEWKYAKYRPYQSPWYGVRTKAMVISKGSYGNGESKNVLPKSVQTPYLPLRGSKVPLFMGGIRGRRMEICETSALPIPMVSRLHQSNGYIKTNLRAWRVKKCIALFGADTVLTSSGPETTPFHWRQYRAQNGNIRNFGTPNPHGTAFAPKHWLHQREATGIESSKIYCQSWWRYRSSHCVASKYFVSLGVVQGQEWKYAKLRPYQSPWYCVCTKAMVISKGSYGHGEFKNVLPQRWRYRTDQFGARNYPVSWEVVKGPEWKYAKLWTYQSPWYRVCTKAMVISKGSYGHGEFKNVLPQLVEISYLSLRGRKVSRFLGGSIGH